MRGDGPFYVHEYFPPVMFSPHAWGWSVFTMNVTLTSSVFPTCVGMVRMVGDLGSVGVSFPHMRGDGPLAE